MLKRRFAITLMAASLAAVAGAPAALASHGESNRAMAAWTHRLEAEAAALAKAAQAQERASQAWTDRLNALAAAHEADR